MDEWDKGGEEGGENMRINGGGQGWREVREGRQKQRVSVCVKIIKERARDVFNSFSLLYIHICKLLC